MTDDTTAARDDRTSNVVDRHVGSRMKARRLECGLTVDALAHLLGVPAASVAGWEDGLCRTPALQLLKISDVLSCPLISFFDGLIVDDPQDQSNSAGDQRLGSYSGVHH